MAHEYRSGKNTTRIIILKEIIGMQMIAFGQLRNDLKWSNSRFQSSIIIFFKCVPFEIKKALILQQMMRIKPP